jgi:hypothetical protein
LLAVIANQKEIIRLAAVAESFEEINCRRRQQHRALPCFTVDSQGLLPCVELFAQRIGKLAGPATRERRGFYQMANRALACVDQRSALCAIEEQGSPVRDILVLLDLAQLERDLRAASPSLTESISAARSAVVVRLTDPLDRPSNLLRHALMWCARTFASFIPAITSRSRFSEP